MLKNGNIDPVQVGISYLNTIGADTAQWYKIKDGVNDLSNFGDEIEPNVDDIAARNLDAHIRYGTIGVDAIKRRVELLNDEDATTLLLAYFTDLALQHETVLTLQHGRELPVATHTRARLTVIESDAVYMQSTLYPEGYVQMMNPRNMQAMHALKKGRALSGRIARIETAPDVGGLIQLKLQPSIYRSIGGLVNPATGKPNVKLEVSQPN
jgi:hypothetical protein